MTPFPQSLPAPIVRYLKAHRVDGPWEIEGTQRNDYGAAVIIPSFDEEETLPATLQSLADNPKEALAKTLVAVVVNHGQDAPSHVREANLRTLHRLRTGEISHPHLNLGWIDAATHGLELPPRDAGVGLARKLGFDAALGHLAYGAPAPFLVSLDADTTVEATYLPSLFRHFANEPKGGAVLPFCHRAGETPEQVHAIERYELFLRHYVLGLSLAGSPYAYHTVGSAMACRADAYVKAGGMNRRRGGEDFYFLQQLAKTSGIAEVHGTVVSPSPRSSARVPFGTGPAVARLTAGEVDAVLFYPSESFRTLGIWLTLVAENWHCPAEDLLKTATNYSKILSDYLKRLDFCTIWHRLHKNHKRRENFMKAFHEWFDALKTLRLIHYLCAQELKKTSPEKALPPLLSWAELEPADKIGKQLALLRALQLRNTT